MVKVPGGLVERFEKTMKFLKRLGIGPIIWIFLVISFVLPLATLHFDQLVDVNPGLIDDVKSFLNITSDSLTYQLWLAHFLSVREYSSIVIILIITSIGYIINLIVSRFKKDKILFKKPVNLKKININVAISYMYILSVAVAIIDLTLVAIDILPKFEPLSRQYLFGLLIIIVLVLSMLSFNWQKRSTYLSITIILAWLMILGALYDVALYVAVRTGVETVVTSDIGSYIGLLACLLYTSPSPRDRG